MSVSRSLGRSVGGRLFTFSAFLYFLSLLLLPKCTRDLLQQCPCLPARDLRSRVSGLVFFQIYKNKNVYERTIDSLIEFVLFFPKRQPCDHHIWEKTFRIFFFNHFNSRFWTAFLKGTCHSLSCLIFSLCTFRVCSLHIKLPIYDPTMI